MGGFVVVVGDDLLECIEMVVFEEVFVSWAMAHIILLIYVHF